MFVWEWHPEMTAAHWILWLSALALQLLVAASLLRGPYRRYPVIAAYIGILTLTMAGGIVLYLFLGWNHIRDASYFWTVEVLRQGLAIAVLLSLVTESIPPRYRPLLWAVVAVLAVSLSGGLAILEHSSLRAWISGTIRNLSFCAAIANLLVWFSLLSRKPRDMTAIIIAGALGLQLAGDALGHSLRYLPLSDPISKAGVAFAVGTDLLCLALWWIAFNRMAALTANMRTRTGQTR